MVIFEISVLSAFHVMFQSWDFTILIYFTKHHTWSSATHTQNCKTSSFWTSLCTMCLFTSIFISKSFLHCIFSTTNVIYTIAQWASKFNPLITTITFYHLLYFTWLLINYVTIIALNNTKVCKTTLSYGNYSFIVSLKNK